MSKVSKPAQTQTPPVMSSVVSTQSAIYILNNKIQKLEEYLRAHMDVIEQKIGDHETYVTDNIPDLELINKALADINTRLLDVDALDARLSAIEAATNIKPPAAPTKKRGTVKLADLTPTPVEPATPPVLGISFS